MSTDTCDFERITRAVAALNAGRCEPVACGHLSVRFLHWGVTPPAYWQSRRHPNPCEIHKHPYYEVCHAFTGRGGFQTCKPDGAQKIQDGDTFFARPGLLHCYGSDAAPVLGICFWSFALEAGAAHASWARSQALLDFAASGVTFVPGDGRTRAALELLFDEVLSGPADAARLHPILGYLAQHLAAAAGPDTQDERAPTAKMPVGAGGSSAAKVLWRAQQYVQDHCHRELRIEELAERCGYSRRHLGRLFRKHAAGSFSAYLARVRVQTACHLLLDESYPLKQVARRTGFGSLPAFARAFKRQTGVTPGEYRARSLGAAR
jgi:AraC-like DNA-binding protein